MFLPAVYRELTLPVTAVRLWDATEAATFTDPGTAGPPTGFSTIPDIENRRLFIQVRGGSCYVTFNKVVAAAAYGWLLPDGTRIDFGVPYHQISFILAASAPVVAIYVR